MAGHLCANVGVINPDQGEDDSGKDSAETFLINKKGTNVIERTEINFQWSTRP